MRLFVVDMICPTCSTPIEKHLNSWEESRCLNAWVHERVMRLPPREHTIRYEEGNTPDGTDGWAGFQCSYCDAPEGSTDPCALPYSTSVSVAFEVLAALRPELWPGVGRVDNFFLGTRVEPLWFCDIALGGDAPSEVRTLVRMVAPEPALSICRAVVVLAEGQAAGTWPVLQGWDGIVTGT